MPHKKYMHRPTVIKDLKVIALVNALLYFVCSYFDVLEKIHELSREYEAYELDEIFTVAITLGVSFLIFSYRRIKELGLLARTLEHMSLMDPLTGLPNRRAGQINLIGWCDRAVKQGEFLVYQIDLDKFKRVNDMYGQAIGDEVLQLVAQKINSELPKSAQLYRWLDDNFLVVIPLKAIESPQAFAHVLQGKVSGQIMTATLNMTCSIGYTLWKNGCTVESILHDADDALIQAKHQGDNEIFASM